MQIYFSPGVSSTAANSMLEEWNLSRGQFPMDYLGVSIFKGCPKRRYFQRTADKIRAKLNSWRGDRISKAGRLSLIKSVIESSFIHSFMIYINGQVV